MSNPHVLNGSEIITLLAALGLILTACVNVIIHLKQSSQRIPARDAVWIRNLATSKKRTFHE